MKTSLLQLRTDKINAKILLANQFLLYLIYIYTHTHPGEDSNIQYLKTFVSKEENEEPKPVLLHQCTSRFTRTYLTTEFRSTYLTLILMNSSLSQVTAHP